MTRRSPITMLMTSFAALGLWGCAGNAPKSAIPRTRSSFRRPSTPWSAASSSAARASPFNGEGDLYVAGDKALWRVGTDGSVERLASMFSNLGLAAIGERDVLAADFGRGSAFDGRPVRDGIIWRISPEGERKRILKKGIIDPNFILVRRDGSFLVSDDAVNEIWSVAPDGELTLFTDTINNPNAWLSRRRPHPLRGPDLRRHRPHRLGRPDLEAAAGRGGGAGGSPEVLAEVGEGHDGLAMDVFGRVYTASNNSGEILRIDPANGEVVVICEDIGGVASLAFGRGDFDRRAIYATNHRTGDVLSVHVGVEGAELVR